MRFILTAVAMCCLNITYCQLPKYIVRAGNDTILLGSQSFEALQEPPFDAWFNKSVDTAHFSVKEARKLRKDLKDISLQIFMGTWCGDSRREVPRLYAFLDYIHFPKNKISLVFVDNEDSAYKESPGKEEQGKYIFRVPTLIISKAGMELGRVIEYPQKNWIADIERIIKKQPYSPHYAGGFVWMQLTDTTTADALLHDSSLLANQMKPIVTTRSELNTVGIIYELNGDTEKAFACYAINRILFPKDAMVLNNLARMYAAKGNRKYAIEYYHQALFIAPGLDDAKQALQLLEAEQE